MITKSSNKFQLPDWDFLTVLLKEKDIHIKVPNEPKITLKQLKKRFENILGIDLTYHYDLFIEKIHLSTFYDFATVEYIIQSFHSSEFEIIKKITVGNEIRIGSESYKINHRTILALADELAMKKVLAANLIEKEKDSISTYEELTLLEKNLTAYLENISKSDNILIPKSQINTSLSITLSSFQGTKTQNEEETEDSLTSKQQAYSQSIKSFQIIQKEKSEILKDKTSKLLNYRCLEKKAYKICKDIELLTTKLDELDTTRDAKEKYVQKIIEKEEKIYAKVQRETTLIKKYIKKNVNNDLSLERIKLFFSRVPKTKYVFKLIDKSRVLIFKMNTKCIKNSELVFRYFKDTCQISKLVGSLDTSNSTYLELNLFQRLYIVIDKNFFVYNFLTNEMRQVTKLSMNDAHLNGGLVYVPYDTSIYSLGGSTSTLVEKYDINSKNNKYDFSVEWKKICNLEYCRSYFSSYVINKKIIYIVVGYDHAKKEYCTDIQKIDVSILHPVCNTFKSKGNHSPCLLQAASIHFADSMLYILGGMLHQGEQNYDVFLFDSVKNQFTKTENKIEKNCQINNPYQTIITDSFLTNNHLTTNFPTENAFLPLKFKITSEENAFYYCLFDNGGYVHLINVRNFNHLILSQESLEEEWDEGSNDEKKNKSNNNSYLTTPNETKQDLMVKESYFESLIKSNIIASMSDNHDTLFSKYSIETEGIIHIPCTK